MHCNVGQHRQCRRRVRILFSHPDILVPVSLIDTIDRIDLTAANHVHLLEPHWNPMAEAQAVDRVHRIGQTREVITTRYVTRDSIETVSRPAPTRELVFRTSKIWLTSNSMSSGFSGTKSVLSINR